MAGIGSFVDFGLGFMLFRNGYSQNLDVYFALNVFGFVLRCCSSGNLIRSEAVKVMRNGLLWSSRILIKVRNLLLLRVWEGFVKHF